MIQQIFHVGLTVSDMDRSIDFYQNTLGLHFQGEIFMEGKETEAMFQMPGCKARVAYLNGSTTLNMPPVELIQFLNIESQKNEASFTQTSISELCFYTEDIDTVYKKLVEKGIECLSSPQSFDFTSSGFGKSKAFYFQDPDGIILEVMQPESI